MKQETKEQIEWVPINEVIPHPKNRNQHDDSQIKRLADIIKYQGWRHPIIVSTLSGYIVAGHGRLSSAKLLGLQKVPVHYQSFEDETQEYAFLVADNAIASWAELDLAGINVNIVDLGPDFDLKMLGIKDFVLDMSEKNGDEYAVPEPPKVAKTKRGELWLLGEHRLLIDDCTAAANVERLMGGEKADMVFTDPPYNVGFEYSQYDDTKVSKEKWKEVCSGWLDSWEKLADKIIVTPGCNNLEVWCQIAPNIKHIAPWIKTNAQITGRVTHFWHWEPIIFIGDFKRKRANDIFEHHVLSGFLRNTGESPVIKGQHPCPKPLSLWLDIMENFSEKTEIIFDPFLGSGSTLIACEKLSRRCFSTEIDPAYVDVCLDRWEKFSGKQAKREDGVLWADIKSQ